jgi:capsular exopolysaccharide synthesis family protein
MSRIHEALRKAAEETGTVQTPEQDTGLDGAGDATSLSREAFPIELGEHRRPRAATPAAPPPPPAPAPAPASIMAPVAQDASERRHSAHNEGPIAFERIDARYAGKVVIDQNISAESREQYRRLAASLHHAQAATGIKIVMLTSAVMGEGKTLTASNLALTLTESYQKQVLLVDADLRRPALQKLFGLRHNAGLSETLIEGSERKVQVHQISQRLGVLAAGRPAKDPIAGLTSARMRRLLEEARGGFDWVIVDTPPVAMLPDANLLAAMVDGAVIVVKAGATPFELVTRAVNAVGREKILGVVLNSVTEHAGHAYYYEYMYTDRPDTPTS